ncbi:MAG: CinA family protein [Candidatus Nanopelagicales bacterium]
MEQVVRDAANALRDLMDSSLKPSEYEFAGAVIAVAKYANITVSTAESLTGGLLATLLTSVEGSSSVFRGSVVVYATDLKSELLKVDEKLLSTQGPVNAETALAMAMGITKITRSSLGLSCTGVAGPETLADRPVGEVHIAAYLSTSGHSRAQSLHLKGNRQEIRVQTAIAMCGIALDVLVPLTDLERFPDITD